MRHILLVALLLPSFGAADEAHAELTGDKLQVVYAWDALTQKLSVEIESLMILDSHTYAVSIKNNEKEPVSIVGTIILYDSTGTAFFVNGSLGITGEFAVQIPSGHTVLPKTTCSDLGDSDRTDAFMSSHCLIDERFDLLDANIALIVVTSIDIDTASRN